MSENMFHGLTNSNLDKRYDGKSFTIRLVIAEPRNNSQKTKIVIFA